ncbi:MAG: glycosyltransferase family 9 protein [bacterium]
MNAPDPREGMRPLERGLLGLLRAPRAAGAPDLRGARILAVQIAGMGDLLLAAPAIRALRRGLPETRVDLLTSRRGGRVAEGCPYLDEVFAFDFRSPPSASPATDWGGLLSAVREIRRRRYAIAVNLIGLYSAKGALRMGLLLRALGIPLLAGRDTRGAGTFYHHALEETLEAPLNERDANLALVRLLGAPDEKDGALELWPGPEEERRADMLASAPSGAGPLVGVNPGSDRPEKVWPEERFMEVMGALRREREARFLLTGGPAEAALTARMAEALGPSAVDTVGRIGFQGTGALMRRMDLFLTCDTAALHLAWAAGTPAVALFKAENLGRYRPETARIECLTGGESAPGAPLEIPAREVLRACRARLEAGREGD